MLDPYYQKDKARVVDLVQGKFNAGGWYSNTQEIIDFVKGSVVYDFFGNPYRFTSSTITMSR